MPVIARNEVPSNLLTVVEIASLGSVVGINRGRAVREPQSSQ